MPAPRRCASPGPLDLCDGVSTLQVPREHEATVDNQPLCPPPGPWNVRTLRLASSYFVTGSRDRVAPTSIWPRVGDGQDPCKSDGLSRGCRRNRQRSLRPRWRLDSASRRTNGPPCTQQKAHRAPWSPSDADSALRSLRSRSVPVAPGAFGGRACKSSRFGGDCRRAPGSAEIRLLGSSVSGCSYFRGWILFSER